MTCETELLLYLAARSQIVREKIKPALKKGMVVICDRFEDSTLAYQGFGRGLPLHVIETVSQWLVRDSLKPDLTILLDIDPKLGMKRGGRHDRMERESLIFHRKVRNGFLKLARRNPKRYIILDALEKKHVISQNIQERLDRELG
ncbi:MAG TPA: dTMP kinase, partial [bacterium]|nr:dTMP kinase [bacterium]